MSPEKLEKYYEARLTAAPDDFFHRHPFLGACLVVSPLVIGLAFAFGLFP